MKSIDVKGSLMRPFFCFTCGKNPTKNINLTNGMSMDNQSDDSLSQLLGLIDEANQETEKQKKSFQSKIDDAFSGMLIAVNVVGSSKAKHSRNYIDLLREQSPNISLCANLNCHNSLEKKALLKLTLKTRLKIRGVMPFLLDSPDLCGAHVYIYGWNKEYLIPLCPSCNNPRSTSPMVLRKDTIIIEAPCREGGNIEKKMSFF